MSDGPGEQLSEEPQTERGPMGSRDTGSDQPGGGPVDRPSGTSDEDDDTSVNPQESQTSGVDLPTGDGGG